VWQPHHIVQSKFLQINSLYPKINPAKYMYFLSLVIKDLTINKINKELRKKTNISVYSLGKLGYVPQQKAQNKLNNTALLKGIRQAIALNKKTIDR